MIKWIKALLKIVREYQDDKAELHKALSQAMFDAAEMHGKQMQFSGQVKKEFVTHYESMQRRMASLDDEIKSRTNIIVDAGYLKGANYVILAGHYRGRDYVQCVALKGDDFRGLAEHIEHMKRHGQVQRVDAPPEFKAVLEWTGRMSF